MGRAFSRLPTFALPRLTRAASLRKHGGIAQRDRQRSAFESIGNLSRSPATLAIAAALVLTTAFPLVLTTPRTPQPYALHAPILIVGDANFTAMNGVTGGSGTPGDPYLIEGWEVIPSGASGVEIRDTTLPFIIRNNLIHQGGPDFDGIYLVNVTNGRIENTTSSNNVRGVRLYLCSNVTIADSNLSSNTQVGLFVSDSAHISVVDDEVTNNQWGIGLGSTTDFIMSGTNVTSNHDGFSASFAINVTISGSRVSENQRYGVLFQSSENITVTGSTVSDNPDLGLYLFESLNLTLASTTFLRDGVVLWGTELPHFNSHDIASDNTVNGLPLRYYKDCAGSVVDGLPTGQLLAANCTSFAAKNLTLPESDYAIEMAYMDGARVENCTGLASLEGLTVLYSTNLSIASSTFSANESAIFLYFSTNVSLTGDNVSGGFWGLRLWYSGGVTGSGITVSSSSQGIDVSSSPDFSLTYSTIANNAIGVSFEWSPGGVIHHNTFTNNTIQAMDGGAGPNTWDDGYPSGGNYWSNYTGVDDCSGALQLLCPDPDGIGDTPFVIDGDSRDRYPLISSPGRPAPPRLLAATLSGPALQDLNLTWRRSGDEGRANGTTGYRILRGSAVDGAFGEIAFLGATGSVNYSYACIGCGHVPGDTNLTFYRVQAVNGLNRTAESNLAARLVKVVQPGRILLSVPLEQTDYSIARVLSTIAVGTVRAYRGEDANDPWKAYYPGRARDLTQTAFGEALWVEVLFSGQITQAGLVRSNATFVLIPGWNLVGYTYFGNRTRAQSLAGIAGVAEVETIDASTGDPYRLRAVAPTEPLQAGEGYWIYLAAGGATWVQG